MYDIIEEEGMYFIELIMERFCVASDFVSPNFERDQTQMHVHIVCTDERRNCTIVSTSGYQVPGMVHTVLL